MAIPKKILKRLQDIRTLSGKVDQADVPHKAYMRLSCLEMEKYRRGKERDSAMHRIESIDSRFRDIEVEKVGILKGLNDLKDIVRRNASGVETHSKSQRNNGGLKLKY